MSLVEKKSVERIEIDSDNRIIVRELNIVERDGVEVSKLYKNIVLVPGDDVTTQNQKVIDVAVTIWTPEVVQAYQDKFINIPQQTVYPATPPPPAPEPDPVVP